MIAGLLSRYRRQHIAAAAAALSVGAILAIPGAVSAATITSTFENPAAFTVPNQGPATQYPSTITATGFTGALTDVDATIRVNHECPANLDILLAGPEGQRTILLSDAGGDCDPLASSTTVTFDDAAVSGYPCDATPSGAFKPTDNATTATGCFSDADSFPSPAPPPPYPVGLSSFDGTNPNGEWNLFIVDDASPQDGAIGPWSLTITAHVKVGRALTLDANKTRVRRGKKVRLSGGIAEARQDGSCAANQNVELQRTKPGQAAFTTVEQLQTDAAGRFSAKRRVKKSFQYRAQVAGSDTCGEAVSNVEVVKVKKPN